MIGKHFLVVGVLCCALVPVPTSAEEIEVYSCDPFEVEVGNGAEMVCLGADWFDDTGQPEDDPFDGPEGDEYSKGPKKKAKKAKKKTGGGNPNAGSAEAKRKAKCQACKDALNQCKAQAEAEELSCQQTAGARAEWRCNINKQSGPGKTPWGCTTNDLFEGACAGVESPWNDRDRWEPGGENTKYYCEQSWRVPHPSGTVTVSDTLNFSALFKGVGASQSSTVSSTYQLTGAKGWLSSCLNVGSQLQNGCIESGDKCFDSNSCDQGER